MRRVSIRRREFIASLAAVAAWPGAARALEPKLPVVGALNTLSRSATAASDAALRQGLSETGYLEGRNVAIEYRYGDGQYDRLPALAADFVRRQVAVMIGGGTPAAVAAKAATARIPIVFTTGSDPVGLGLVANLNRPGENVTGVSFLADSLAQKRLELASAVFPGEAAIGFLANSADPHSASEIKAVEAAARALGRDLHVERASDEKGLEAAFANFARERIKPLMLSADVFFLNNREQMVALAARYAIPMVYHQRELVAAGGLMSYGASITDSFRLAGIYAGRILKGEKPADLPVHQAVKTEFIVNLKTAKALGLEIPPRLVALADEVIE